MKILFTGVGRRVELLQAFKNAALVLNKELKIYGTDITDTAPAIAYCDYVRKVVSMKDEKYIDNLLQICEKDKINLIIPTIDFDLLELSTRKQDFENIKTRVMISSPEMIRICRDKNYTSRFFLNCGLHAPIPVNDWKMYKGSYPAFIKPKDGSSSIHAFKVENEEELKIYIRHIDDYIIQPFIEGKEYTIDIFCDWEGNPLSIIPRERVQVRAGEVLKTRITMDQVMIEESKILCKVFKACGPMTVQLIRDIHTGVDYFIEINPRFGGGAPLSMKAGAKSAEAILKLLDHEQVEYYTDIADGTVYSRFDQSICVNQNRGKIKGVIFDLDDTLYSEKEYIKSGYKMVSEYLGGGYEERLWDFFEQGKFAIDELLHEIGKESEKQAVLSIYHNHKPDIHPYSEVKEIISYFKKRDIKLGIITDGRFKEQQNKLHALNLPIEDIIITDELGGTQFRKPCDISFRIMAVKWRLPFEQIVYVGDNLEKDHMAPLELGMKFIHFNNKNGLYNKTKISSELMTIESVDNLNDLKLLEI